MCRVGDHQGMVKKVKGILGKVGRGARTSEPFVSLTLKLIRLADIEGTNDVRTC